MPANPAILGAMARRGQAPPLMETYRAGQAQKLQQGLQGAQTITNIAAQQQQMASQRREQQKDLVMGELYNQYRGEGPQSEAALMQMYRVDPQMTQDLVKGGQEVNKGGALVRQKIVEASKAEREEAQAKIEEKTYKAVWANTAKRWEEAGFKDKQGNPVPFSERDRIIAQGVGLRKVFEDVMATEKRLEKKGTTKDTRTALQKEVPFIAEKLGITEEEAMQLRLQGQGKNPAVAWGSFYTTALSQFGDEDEARAAADQAVEYLYGKDWKRGMPGQVGKKEREAPAPAGAQPKGELMQNEQGKWVYTRGQ